MTGLQHRLEEASRIIAELMEELDATQEGVIALEMERKEREALASELSQTNSGMVALTLELERSKFEVVTKNQELEAFSYSVSHDLRAPLRAIGQFAQVLLELHGEQFSGEAHELLERVLVNVHTMEKLIEGLLVLAHVSRANLAVRTIDLSAMATSIIAELREGDPGRSPSVTIESGLTTEGDVTLTRSLLTNLLANAWKFTSRTENAQIRFAKSADTDSATFCVIDNGVGIGTEQIGRLFAPFARAHSATLFPGVGVGLATARRIARRHGGDLWVESEEGAGCTFYFTLTKSSRTSETEG